MADEYHKIAGPFKRAADNIKEVDRNMWLDDTVQMLADSTIWNATEKIDGTNIRVVWDGHNFSLGGRTDRAELHKDLVTKILSYFGEGVEEKVEELFGEKEVIFVGEGYGAGIQSGGYYSPNKEFVGFDVRVNGSWLSFSRAKVIFDELGIPVLPTIYDTPTTLNRIIEDVSGGSLSRVASANGQTVLSEGMVARPVIPLYDRHGKRVIVKVKSVDLFREGF